MAPSAAYAIVKIILLMRDGDCCLLAVAADGGAIKVA